MAATAVTLNNPEGHSPVVGLVKCNLSIICATFYTISTDCAGALPLHLYESRDYRQEIIINARNIEIG